MNNRIIKMLGTKNFEISLIQDENGLYYVEYAMLKYEAKHKTEPTSDLKWASYMFDKKIQELEGN